MYGEFTVTEHFEELRRRVIFSVLALIAATAVSVPFSPVVLKFLKYPSGGAIERLVFFGPEEAFLIYMRISVSAGVVIALPVMLFQLWAFLSPAIDERFRKYAFLFVSVSFLVFLLGCSFSYFILLPAALKFLLSIGRTDLEPVISAARYISFVTGLILACGIVFEMPVVSFFLTRIGVINAGMLRRKFLYAVVVIMIIAAVITPTGDAFNMLMLALPMLALYEVSVWVSFFSAKRKVAV
ncbi:MAG: twin-arginine translocase subunit TatC [Candidatus Omnitrophica bacterium]|nr:twin-arginine translocase subunit TatC [Candidatus Omnitrophota bacterium]MDD5437058.1 twin-arginine translocase subunit TatC [Candidatus Omnitrophota bacterium]